MRAYLNQSLIAKMKTKITPLLKTNKTGLLFAVAILVCTISYTQQVINATLVHDGKTREYRLYVPESYSPNKAAPLILNYHGYTNTIDIQYNNSDFRQLAEDNQFLFVTPQGLGNNAGWAIDNVFFGGNEDDLGFSNALINKIQEDFNINEKRIYATGFSNGGYFSYKLACELSSRIAAIASVAGSMTSRWIDRNECQPEHPTPVLQITGTRDTTIPISGGVLGKSINEVMTYWSGYNNADSTPDIIDLGSGSTHSIYDNGDNDVNVEFIKVGGKGHSWNGGNVSTSQEVWKFFSQYDLDGKIQPLSNDEFENNNAITIYPNPTSSSITIKNINFTNTVNYNITNVAGQLLMSGRITSKRHKIDLANLATSVYFLNIANTTFKIAKVN